MTFVQAKQRALRMAVERRIAATNQTSVLEQRTREQRNHSQQRVDNSEWGAAIEAERDAEALELLAGFVP